uniref:Glycosyl transferase family 2 n=1 Tax=Candidatus Kentrum sp. DK TaxID=2126562 RepID=A0A450SQ09_9GAMM|nr:MAG: hypothetical protein BECKDK2373C_GA0170839_10525 [Candidatus Kentron sp. DK]
MPANHKTFEHKISAGQSGSSRYAFFMRDLAALSARFDITLHNMSGERFEECNSILVIPTFGRAAYVRECLASLENAFVNTDTLVCIVDETNAAVSTDTFQGFRRFYGMYYSGDGIRCVKAPISTVYEEATKDDLCVAFDESGWMKSALEEPVIMPDSNFSFYIRESFLERNPAVRMACDSVMTEKSDDHKAARRVVEEFRPGNISVIKLFKRNHVGMFDSLKVGFDLGSNYFRYLINLDSDTIHNRAWIDKLKGIYREISAANPDKSIILSGFHTPAHGELEKHGSYRVKKSLGGLNLFFEPETYSRYVKKHLYSVGWDWGISERGDEGLLLAATRPSVIQHIGEHGLWSRTGRCDEADDFVRDGS